jgi:hypothetical protein
MKLLKFISFIFKKYKEIKKEEGIKYSKDNTNRFCLICGESLTNFKERKGYGQITR